MQMRMQMQMQTQSPGARTDDLHDPLLPRGPRRRLDDDTPEGTHSNNRNNGCW